MSQVDKYLRGIEGATTKIPTLPGDKVSESFNTQSDLRDISNNMKEQLQKLEELQRQIETVQTGRQSLI